MNDNRTHFTHSIRFNIGATLLTFFYIYQCNLSFLGIPEQLHSLRVSALIIVIWAVIKTVSNKKITCQHDKGTIAYKSFFKYLKLCVFLCVYAAFLIIVVGQGTGHTFLDVMMNIALFSLPICWAYTRLFANAESFMYVLFYVGVVQSFVIIFCVFDEAFATFLDLTFNQSESDYTAIHRGGYAGGLGCITAPGVIRYSTGLIACVYLYLKKRNPFYLLSFIVFAILSSMIARTGILIDAVCLLFLLKGVRGSNQTSLFIVFGVLMFFLSYLVISSGKYDVLLSERYQRVNMLQETGLKEGFFDHYFKGEDTEFPPLNADMFLGTGIVSGKSGNGYIINVDGGPLRLYSAIGMFFCIFIYVFIFLQLRKIAKSVQEDNNRLVLWLYMCVLLLGDFKEMTFFTVYSLCIYFTTSILLTRDEYVFREK